MFQKKVVEKINTQILHVQSFLSPENPAIYKVEKYGTARQATDENMKRRMRFAWWVIKATQTHTQNV